MANVLVRNKGRTLLDLRGPKGRSLAGSRDAHERNILSAVSRDYSHWEMDADVVSSKNRETWQRNLLIDKSIDLYGIAAYQLHLLLYGQRPH